MSNKNPDSCPSCESTNVAETIIITTFDPGRPTEATPKSTIPVMDCLDFGFPLDRLARRGSLPDGRRRISEDQGEVMSIYVVKSYYGNPRYYEGRKADIVCYLKASNRVFDPQFLHLVKAKKITSETATKEKKREMICRQRAVKKVIAKQEELLRKIDEDLAALKNGRLPKKRKPAAKKTTKRKTSKRSAKSAR
jgi:hypothetical protein